MNETNSDHDRPDNKETAATGPSKAGRSTVSGPRILLIVAPLALLFVAALVFFGVFDGPRWLSSLMRAPLVHTEVRVTFRGEPLPDAVLITRPAKEGLRGALGMPTGEPGRYVLKTDLAGQYQEGAYAGQHKVTAARYGLSRGASPPPLLTPQKYSSLDTTDLTIEITRDPELNQFELELIDDGSVSEDQGSPAGGGGPPSVAEMVERTFSNYDQDGDENLIADEIKQIDNEQRRRGIQDADTDGDGTVTRQELTTAIEAFVEGFQEGSETVQGGPQE